MATGASGGAWVIDDEFINGVVSYTYPGQRRWQYGPYFDGTVRRFINRLP